MASNPYVNKVQLADGTPIMDISSSTVSPQSLMEGYTAFDASGAPITGTAKGGAEDGYVWQDGEGYVHLSDKSGTERIVSEVIAEPYDSTSTYAVGGFCSNNGKFYVCNTNISTPEEWNANHWTELTVADAIPDISGKADKVSGATTGNFAALDSTGNLVDSGHKHSDYLTSHQNISGKADKVSNATNNNFAALDASGNLKDSGHKHSDYLTSHQDISGKADKVSSATNNNFAALDANGNLKDSGHKHSDYLTAHQDISGKADKVSNPTNGNFAALNSSGNLVDSGHKHSDYLTQHQDISGKTDKVANATNGNFASLNSSGNLVDSGHKHSDYLTAHQDISGKADKVSSATDGHFASLDANGNLVDSGHQHSDYLTEHQDISGLESDIEDLQTDLGTAQGDISDIQDDIEDLQSDVGDLQTGKAPVLKVAKFNSGNAITSAGTYTVTVSGVTDYWRPTEIVLSDATAVLLNWSWSINSSGVCSLTIPSGGIKSSGTSVRFILGQSNDNG